MVLSVESTTRPSWSCTIRTIRVVRGETPQHAELVALRVSENLPGLLALTDVDSGGPELECSVDLFSVAVVHWTEIEV